MEKLIIVSGPVIVKDNKVLLDKHKDPFWKFCGGKMEENETLRETAIKRAKEELGIDINITDQKPFLMHAQKPGEEEIDVLLVHWLADFTGEVTPGEMVEEWQWLDINDLPNDLAPNIIPTLKHFGFIK